MHKKKVYKWLSLTISTILALALYNGWILLPGFYKESYYRFDTPDGIDIISNHSVLTFKIQKDVKIRVFARCHHYAFQDNSKVIDNKCLISVFLDGYKLKFANHTEFIVEDIYEQNKSHQIDTEVRVIESKKEWARIKFKNENHPNSIRLLIPEVTIEEKLINTPVLTGNYVEKIRFDPFILLFLFSQN